MTTSSTPSLLERFESMSIQDIDDMVNRREPESLHLDFKILTDPAFGKPDKENLATAISGFANAEGGVIVWGVDARPAQDEVDAANCIVQVSNVAQALSRANQLTPEATSPAITGVRHRSVERSNGAGHLITFVPVWDGVPLQATFAGHRYYQRMADRFQTLHGFQVAALFGRRSSPKLELRVEFLPYGTPSQPQFLFRILVCNVGRSSAKHVEVRWNIDQEYSRHVKPPGGGEPLLLPRPRAMESSLKIHVGEPACVIHPGGNVPFLNGGAVSAPRNAALPPFVMRYELHAEHMEPVIGRIHRDDSAIRSELNRRSAEPPSD